MKVKLSTAVETSARAQGGRRVQQTRRLMRSKVGYRGKRSDSRHTSTHIQQGGPGRSRWVSRRQSTALVGTQPTAGHAWLPAASAAASSHRRACSSAGCSPFMQAPSLLPPGLLRSVAALPRSCSPISGGSSGGGGSGPTRCGVGGGCLPAPLLPAPAGGLLGCSSGGGAGALPLLLPRMGSVSWGPAGGSTDLPPSGATASSFWDIALRAPAGRVGRIRQAPSTAARAVGGERQAADGGSWASHPLAHPPRTGATFGCVREPLSAFTGPERLRARAGRPPEP